MIWAEIIAALFILTALIFRTQRELKSRNFLPPTPPPLPSPVQSSSDENGSELDIPIEIEAVPDSSEVVTERPPPLREQPPLGTVPEVLESLRRRWSRRIIVPPVPPLLPRIPPPPLLPKELSQLTRVQTRKLK